MIDLMSLNPQQVEKFIHIQSAVERQKIDHAKTKAYRDYYYGEHPVLLNQRQMEFLGGLLTGSDFPLHHNVSKIVIDTIRERLSIDGFSVNGIGVEDETEDGQNLAALFWSWWEDNRLDSQQQRLYRRTLRDGKSYVMVDYDSVNMRPRIRLHKLDDGKSGIVVHRNPADPEEIFFINRYFYSSIDYTAASGGSTLATTAGSGTPRKTVYLPHEIRKYAMSKGGSWGRFMDEGDTVWPIPWVDGQGQPIGLNVFEFENPSGSELSQIIGLQNALNKTWIDLIAAADASGFPILAIEYDDDDLADLNQGDDDDLEGDDELKIAPGRALEVYNANVKRIEAGDMTAIVETIWTITMAISSVTKVPHHELRPFTSVANLSGESFRKLEAPLIKRVGEKQIVSGQSWKDVFAMAYKLETIFGRLPQSNERLAITPNWASAETQDRKSDAEVARIEKELGVPDGEVFGTLGYSPEQIQQFAAEARRNRASDIASIAGAIRVNETRNQQQVNPETGAI